MILLKQQLSSPAKHYVIANYEQYLDGGLSQAEKDFYQSHLSNCEECQAWVERQENLIGLIQMDAPPTYFLPPAVAERIHQNVYVKMRRAMIMNNAIAVFGAAAAVAIVVVIAGVFFWWQSGDINTAGDTDNVEEITSVVMEPATDSPTPATNTLVDVKEPVTCDGVEGPCVEVTFDGENCLVDRPLGPAPAGLYVFAFNNASGGVAGIEAAKRDVPPSELRGYLGGIYIISGIDGTGFTTLLGMGQQPVGAGESAIYQYTLESGDYAILCSTDEKYAGAIYGDALYVR